MLVLSRKPAQTVMIGSDIRVTVVRLEGNQVRIGIEAPHDVRILRGELTEETEEHSGRCNHGLEALASASS